MKLTSSIHQFFKEDEFVLASDSKKIHLFVDQIKQIYTSKDTDPKRSAMVTKELDAIKEEIDQAWKQLTITHPELTIQQYLETMVEVVATAMLMIALAYKPKSAPQLPPHSNN